MLLGLFALCIVILRFFPETTLARVLNSALVEPPLAWLANVRRRDLIFLLLVGVLLLAAGDFIAVFGMSELLMIGASLSVYFDAVLVTTAVTIAATAVTARRYARARLGTRRYVGSRRRTSALRERATRKTRRPRPGDDEDAPAWGLALTI